MRKPNGRLHVAVLCAVLLASCTSVKVAVDWDRDADFTQYRTFAFQRREGRGVGRPMGPIVRKNAENAIRAELSAKGLREVDGEKPDLRVALHTGSKEKLEGNRYGYVGPRGYWHYGGRTVTEYTEGRLTIDLVDTASHSLVWRGIGRAVVDDTPSDTARDIVHEVLKDFPPKR
jgi:hypothetical protein